MNKKILKTTYIFSLLNIKAGDAPVQIEANKIKIIDLLTNEEFTRKDVTKIEIGNPGVNYDAILNNIDFFENTKNEKLSNEQKNYKVMFITNGGNELKDENKVDETKELDIYISKSAEITENKISIAINNEDYNNTVIKKIINKDNKANFDNLNKDDETKIIEFLNLETIKCGEKEITKILKDEETIKKYYIKKLILFKNNDPKTYKEIDDEAVKIFKNSILSNGTIKLELKEFKNPINLSYEEKNLKENIKELLKGIKNGKTDINSNCKAIIEALKEKQNEGIYKIIKDGDSNDSNNDSTEITDKGKEYKLTLPNQCYEVEITANFIITSNDKDEANFKFKDVSKFERDTILKLKIDKGTNLGKLKEILNEKFELKNAFENPKIIYKNNTGSTINDKTSFDDNSTISINIDKTVTDLVIDKNTTVITLKFKNNVAGKEFQSTFTQSHPTLTLKSNNYNTLLEEVKKFLKTTDESSFEIYKDKNKLNNSDTLKDNDQIEVQILKNIDTVLKDIVDKNNNNNNNNNDTQTPKDGEIKDKGKDNKKICSNYKQQ